MQVEKTVFISYRRANMYHARAVYQELTQHGYDVFLDYESIDSGSFSQVILNQIAARAHFLIILTPSALERCVNADDWLRREIEYAIDHQRNIVPLLFDHFEYEKAQPFLAASPKLQLLNQYNGLEVPSSYFMEAMERLRNRYLNKPLELILHPVPPAEKAAAAEQKKAAENAPTPTPEQLRAEYYFEQGFTKYQNGDWEKAIDDFTRAILLNSEFGEAYMYRGLSRKAKGDLDGAIADYTITLKLNPKHAKAYYNRGNALRLKGDLDGAISDYEAALQIDPQYAMAYNNLGNAHKAKGDLDSAIANYARALQLDPQHAKAHYNRGNALRMKGDLDRAITDYEAALRIDPNYEKAKRNLKEVREIKKKY